MFDRLRSGAAAVASGVDGALRSAASAPRLRRFFDRRGAQIVALVLLLGGAWSLATGLDALAFAEPRSLDATAFADGSQPERSRVTASGGLLNAWVETFRDDDGDEIQDRAEPTEWAYFLLDEDRSGLVVLSSRGPQAVFRETIRGTVFRDPDYVAEVIASLDQNWGPEVTEDIHPDFVIDRTDPGTGTPETFSPDRPPSDGTPVSYTAVLAGPWVALCAPGVDVGSLCDEPDEIAGYDFVVYDPRSFTGIVVFQAESPEVTEATFDGVLDQRPATIQRVLAEAPTLAEDYELRLTEQYVLREGVPSEARRPVPLLFGVGALALGGFLVLLVGAASRPFVWRPSPRGLSSGLADGAIVQAHLSGPAWSPAGLHRFREIPVQLVASDDRVAISDPSLAGFELAAPTPDAVSTGTAHLFGGARPGVRLARPDGTLFLTVLDVRERDALAASMTRSAGRPAPPTPPAAPAMPTAPPGPPGSPIASGSGLWPDLDPAPPRPDPGWGTPDWQPTPPPVAPPPVAPTPPPAPGGPLMQTNDLTDVRRQLDAAGKPFLEFMRSSDLSVGLFVLPAGGIDNRTPNTEDAVYHVTTGRARVVMGEVVQVVGPGSVVYVRAGVEHRFVAIESELSVLVVFAPAQASRAR